ncbi:acyl carrier protein [Pseudomonas sp. 910_23]|uniref:MacpA n=3 Tax=Pseudomonas TaxID=286 RepID=Q8RL70_PSEFL|nr:MacpA [Pseudomonas fluorescens]MCK3837611.1 acyl carrier protein [Pseudomonas sp. NCIMB 10586]MCK3842382.1 acyl carrier protein [Pseudomonas sp. W15Feb34]MCK3849595.1 acyl carrier protein [Pseudomonas sp. W2Jun17]MCK3865982.1 acyl carrier protein [Pseudomonas sp. B329]TYK54251.1 acyl carrier protein [Pseudomonas synxantha]
MNPERRNMYMEEIYTFVVSTLASSCKVQPGDIEPTTNLFADLGIDSVDFLDAVFCIEKHYDIRIPVGQWMSAVNEGNAAMTDYFVMEHFVAQIAARAAASA